MAETCIVCLGDLRHYTAEDPPPETAEDVANANKGDAKKSTRAAAKSIGTDEESIAHILPCKHDLHHACLVPWIERANSCPICRAKFNMVELRRAVRGPVIDSYAVQDKVQEAELDPAMVVEEDELFAVEACDPCILCGDNDDTYEMMYCDGCPKAIHVFCAGYEEVPEVWYCETCLADFDADTGLRGLATAVQQQPRRRANNGGQRLRGRGRDNDAVWAQVWQAVSRRLDLDLDFPYDDEPFNEDQPQPRRQWESRFRVARSQGVNTTRLRDIASGRLNRQSPGPVPQPESQEEIRAWNAFDKARESQEAPASIRGRKRKTTASPASPQEPQPTDHPQQKRPRLRRRPDALDTSASAESSHAAAQRNTDDRSTFLGSLLKDVENKPLAASSPGASEQYNGQWSPRNSSSAGSPISSPHTTPRALSPTPPPQQPLSPPLSTSLFPASTPEGAIFSPFSPSSAAVAQREISILHRRGRPREPPPQRRDSDTASPGSAGSSSPSRLSYSAKEEVQRMVKLALGPLYRDKEISKERYTDINRDVSRKMYELVGHASALADQAEREKWQDVAEEEVKKAVSAVHFGPRDGAS